MDAQAPVSGLREYERGRGELVIKLTFGRRRAAESGVNFGIGVGAFMVRAVPFCGHGGATFAFGLAVRETGLPDFVNGR
ncbi:MAG: hypothetical protein OXF55_06970 [Caldilineaceae bacterium]|nr:hypothetical protein [Caldilineaceae bacterium]